MRLKILSSLDLVQLLFEIVLVIWVPLSFLNKLLINIVVITHPKNALGRLIGVLGGQYEFRIF